MPAQDPFAGVAKDQLLLHLKACTAVPPYALASKFDPTNEAALLEAFRHTQRLPERTGLVWVLAHIGGDDTARAFIHTLTKEFDGRSLVADDGNTLTKEESVLQTIVGCLGLLAARSDRARQFLVQATEPAFWQQTVRWKSTTGPEINALLAADAIQSVGMLDHPEKPALLEGLKKNLPVDRSSPPFRRHTFEGDVLQAAFYADLLKQKGAEDFYRWILDTSRDMFDPDGAYRSWKTNSNGQAWMAWYNEARASQP